MTDTSFQIGDIVRLKSGGPEMTLEKFDAPFPETGEATAENTNLIPYCVWFDSTNRVMRGSFASISLEKVKNSEIGSAKTRTTGGLNDGY